MEAVVGGPAGSVPPVLVHLGGGVRLELTDAGQPALAALHQENKLLREKINLLVERIPGAKSKQLNEITKARAERLHDGGRGF